MVLTELLNSFADRGPQLRPLLPFALSAAKGASFPPCHITPYPLCFSVMRAPRKLFSESDLYNAALRALMRRAHSVYEMRQALERRADDKTLVRRVLDRLKEGGLLDDSRYARQFARYHAETRHQGKFRIGRDLRDRHIESALDEVFQEKDEGEMVRKRIDRKLKSFRGEIDDRRLASIYRSLLRAGFTSDVIRRELSA